MAIQSSATATVLDNDDLAFALERIKRAEIQRDPFPHIIVDGLFPEAFFTRMLRNFPDRACFQKVEYPGTGHGRGAKNYHDYGLACRDLAGQPVFAEVHALFRSDAFSRVLLEKFARQLDDGFWPIPFEKHRHFAGGAADYTSVFDLQIDLSGYAIPPHPDVPSKLVTFQFFLPSDGALREYGTLFCRPKRGRPTADRGPAARAMGSLVTRAVEKLGLTQTGWYKRLERTWLGLELGIGDNRNWLPWSLIEIVKVAPALPNYFMAFPPNSISYHAVRFDIPGQQRPVVRGFIRAGSNTKNWIHPKGL